MYTKADSHATEWTRLSVSVAKLKKKMVGFPDAGTVNIMFQQEQTTQQQQFSFVF